jgi:heavy metal translocating P-type ATPase
MIPVDGEIVEGVAAIDERVVTGEPLPVFRQKGDRVISGSVNTGAQLKIRTSKPGEKSFLYVMAREIAASLKVKPVLHRKADRIVQFFIPGVVCYALGVFLFVVAFGGDAETGLLRMSAVLAVACPCAWALAVPTAFAAGIGGLGARGVLVRGGTALEMAGRAVNVVLDKTGTVTLARPRVVGIESFGRPQAELLCMAASVESGFNHPIANAILRHAASRQVNPLPAERSEYLPGVGVKSIVQGHEVVLGSSETVTAMGMKMPPDAKPDGRATWIAIDGRIAGVIVLNDDMADSAEQLADVLHGLGVRQVVLATGDNDAAEAQRVAARIGADRCRWGLTPGDKTDLVRELSILGPTVMVGDGVNDATSLAASDVGISIGHDKADLAIQSSDIIVLKNDAGAVPAVVRAGKRLIRTIRLNYGWAIGFNLAGMALATAGGLSPWLAAVLHHFSSVLVVANSARLAKMANE